MKARSSNKTRRYFGKKREDVITVYVKQERQVVKVISDTGVLATSSSTRNAKRAVKEGVRYYSNIDFIARNYENEADAAISVAKKPLISLESKYEEVEVE